MNDPAYWSRQKFIATLTGAGAAVMINPFCVHAMQAVDPRVAEIVRSIIGIDTHNHIDVPLISTEVPGPKIDLRTEMQRSGLTAICMTFAVDYQQLRNPGDAYERFINGMASMDQQLIQNDIKRALNLSDLRDARRRNQSIIIQSVEGGHFLEGKLDRLGEAYGRGLRHLGLLHDNDASVPLGDVFTNPVRWGGLTNFGAETIRECNRLGMLVDLSHANSETLSAALRIAKYPVIVSHTGLDTQLGQNEFMAKMMKPRLINSTQAKTIADAGGVIGVWTHLAETPEAYAQNIRALVNIVGIDHVCIGTDTKLTAAYRAAPVPTTNVTANNNQQNRERPGERTNNAWANTSLGFLFTVLDAMLKSGFTESEIGKIGGENFCRVFDAATKIH